MGATLQARDVTGMAHAQHRLGARAGQVRWVTADAARYSSLDLADQLATQWTLISQAREERITPQNVIEPFCWTTLRKDR